MDAEPYLDEESKISVEGGGSAPYAGAFFPSSQQLLVEGGVFTSNFTNIHQNAPTLPPDFRMIPMGDIDLRKEIRLDPFTGMVDFRVGRGVIDGRQSNMTVAVYQGHNAEETWLLAIIMIDRFRHPNFVQIYGAASSCGIHATIFHDDLIPRQDFQDLYRHSHFTTVYIFGYCKADDYLRLAFKTSLISRRCSHFIRRSTGNLCVDILPNAFNSFGTDSGYLVDEVSSEVPVPESILTVNGPVPETIVINSFRLKNYHSICFFFLQHSLDFLPSARATVQMGAPSKLEESSEVALLVNPPEIVYNACDMASSKIFSMVYMHETSWLGQANHIFTRLQVESNYEDYDPPDGYLFLRPIEEFQTGPGSGLFRSGCPGYWSFDPSGAVRLSSEEANTLGFPAIGMEMTVRGRSWDASVYAGLRKVHHARGFDPDSQDVARHLEYPLYQLSSDTDIPFAHGEPKFAGLCGEEGSDNDESGDPATEDIGNLPAQYSSMDDDNSQAFSQGWKLVMLTKAVLILFLTLSWLKAD
ncbi:hypothetical protein B0H17DRAFT_1089008 [Mycena rosella]|uniref:Uncharacterized protein n=1 Tax=Mycena rosella TaxID=1033263 RepID=A0AAD7CWT0_MYCRO|nr:hypothetical protein B0H17DRAFT_1089008 [Mycena rosella]